MLLDKGNRQQNHRQHEQNNLCYVLFSHGLESEIDERTEAGGVQGGHTKHKGKSCYNPYGYMLSVGEVREIDLFLNLLAEFGQRKEREESRHDHRDVEL